LLGATDRVAVLIEEAVDAARERNIVRAVIATIAGAAAVEAAEAVSQ
jgi:hypothetical protein